MRLDRLVQRIVSRLQQLSLSAQLLVDLSLRVFELPVHLSFQLRRSVAESRCKVVVGLLQRLLRLLQGSTDLCKSFRAVLSEGGLRHHCTLDDPVGRVSVFSHVLREQPEGFLVRLQRVVRALLHILDRVLHLVPPFGKLSRYGFLAVHKRGADIHANRLQGRLKTRSKLRFKLRSIVVQLAPGLLHRFRTLLDLILQSLQVLCSILLLRLKLIRELVNSFFVVLVHFALFVGGSFHLL
mmetsp:Transcript_8961/g.29905  ORF Transcript_8961/g.29905 Transcript_8961/m.29905 type:complete len:239 (-) Transcript_8961:1706-2422(-)